MLGYLNEKHDHLVRPEVRIIKKLRILILPTSFYLDLVGGDINSWTIHLENTTNYIQSIDYDKLIVPVVLWNEYSLFLINLHEKTIDFFLIGEDPGV